MRKGIIGIAGTFVGFAAGIILGRKSVCLDMNKDNNKIDKFKSYYNILNQWLFLKQNNRSLSEYFKTNNYKTIGIYGMGELGARLYEELKNSSITVKYAADKSSNTNILDINVIDVNDMTDDVDLVVVTPVFAMDDIKDMLEKYLNCPIISLEDIVYEVSAI